ncbi:MAG: glycosyltransferase family 2 protein [Actinomycetota bacterium]
MNEVAYGAEPRVLVVVVAHNGGQWLNECLTSIASQDYRRLRLLVVDNGSREPVAPLVARYAPRAEMMRSERNLGFGAACNAGLEASKYTHNADYFLFLHDDVALQSGAVRMLVNAAEETSAGVVGGKGLDWNRPQVLLEVGMSADQFCVPYSGLDEGEIDQGQYEAMSETLYVTNACFLVSRSLAERCGLFDGAYFAFGEDLDLCLRARLAGFKVVFQPKARFRHAAALSNDIRPLTAPIEARGLMIRRNQLRTIAKNMAGPRMVLSLAMCGLLGVMKTMALVAFRRFDEIPDYPRAGMAFLRSLPKVMVRRRAVQKRRRVRDRTIRRFMIRDSHRLRLQIERRFRQWDKGSLAFGAQKLSNLSVPALRQRLSSWLHQPLMLSTLLIGFIGVVAMRKVLLGGPIAGGSLWPFPDDGARFIAEYLSGWRNAGLGTESAAPAAFPLLWVANLLAFGKPVLAQKLLILFGYILGLTGIARLVKRTSKSPVARVVAVAVYGLSPVVHLIVSSGDLGALALFAGLPFALGLSLSIIASGAAPDAPPVRAATPLAADNLVADAARLALIVVAVVALAPSSMVAFVLLFGLMVLGRWLTGAKGDEFLRRIKFLFLAPAMAGLVLIPWIFEGLRPSGAIFGPLFSGLRSHFYPLWRGVSFQDMFLLNMDNVFGGLVTATIVGGALLLTTPSRRAEARLLSVGAVGFALVGGMAGKGLIPTPVASPAIWMGFLLVIMALLASHLVSGLQEELPRHAFGWRHKFAIPVSSVTLAVGFAIGWVPPLLSWDRPAASFAGGTAELSSSVSTFFRTTAAQVGDFRVLWLGDRWSDPVRAGLGTAKGEDFFITGSEGLTLLDAFPHPPAQGERRLEQAVDAMMDLRLHLAGHLLGPANVRFIVVDPDDSRTMDALARQRDVALEQQQEGVAIFRNLQWLPRASFAPAGLAEGTAEADDTEALMLARWTGGRQIPARSPSKFTIDVPRTSHTQVLLGDNYNRGWRAAVDGEQLEQSEAFRWANRFELPPTASGNLEVYFVQHWIRFAWLVLEVLCLAAVIALARSVRER